ncbi:hypothetical protein R0J90_16420, partial [Micrococcus sp. SIMBA_144]
NFIGKYYLNNKELPNLPKLDDLNDYYKEITKNYQNPENLLIFLSSDSYFMLSELEDLLGYYASLLIKNIIADHPYLFEVKLNRVSLVHD